VVTVQDFPRSPQASRGRAIPWALGPIKGVPFRDPYTAKWSGHSHAMEHTGGGQYGVPGLIVDNGRGYAGQKAKILFTTHACKRIHDPDNGATVFLEVNGRLVPIDPEAADQFNAASGAGFTLPDSFDRGSYAISPVDVVAALSNPASEPRYVLDELDETTFALFDWDASKRDMHWRLPAINPPGEGLNYFLRIGYVSSGSLTNFSIGLKKGGSETNHSVPASATPGRSTSTALGIAWGAAPLPSNPWDFSESLLRCGWTTGTNTGQWVLVFFAGIEVQFRPGHAKFMGEKRVMVTREFGGAQTRRSETFSVLTREFVVDEFPVITTLEGVPDDGSGTLTGVADALIERPPDAFRWLLLNEGAQVAGQINSAGSTHGSYVDARAVLKTRIQTDMICGLYGQEQKPLDHYLLLITEAAQAHAFINRFDDKWQFVPWRPSAGGEYARKLYAGDFVRFPEVRDQQRLITGARVRYRWSGERRGFLHEVSCARGSSSSGHLYRNIREHYLTVVSGVNDRIDMTDSVNTSVIQLTAGDYTPEAFIDHVITRIRADAAAWSAIWGGAYGGRIIANVCDRIDFNDGAAKTATLTTGVYTMEGLAAHAQTQMNAVSTNWTVTYSRATRKFTFTRSSGTAQLLFGVGAPNETRGAAAAYGFGKNNLTGLSTYTSDHAHDERIFGFTTNTTFEILWETGANGINAATPRHAGELLGFDPIRDTTPQTVPLGGYYGITPKGNREQDCAANGDDYGNHDEITIDGRAICDDDTALATRDALLDLHLKPPPEVSFTTVALVDLELGQRLEVDAELDAIVRYSKEHSDGSWAGRRFRANEVHQEIVTGYTQEVVVTEAT